MTTEQGRRWDPQHNKVLNRFLLRVLVVLCFLMLKCGARLKLMALSPAARNVGGGCLSWDLEKERIDSLIRNHGRNAMLAATAELFENSNDELHGCAAQTLRRLGGEDAVNQLVRAVERGRAMSASSVALGALGDPRSGKVLLEILHDSAPHREWHWG